MIAIGRARILRWLAILAITAGAILGLLWITPGYGMSTDEQVNFDVGTDALRAYLSPAGLEEYLTHGDPLAHHGPSYFVLWSALSKALARVLDTWRIADARHLVTFLTFGLAVFCLYRLLLRVAAPRFAWMTAALFATQPLLFGHGFINQKDTPFMAFFLASVVVGLTLVDRLALSVDTRGGSAQPSRPLPTVLRSEWEVLSPCRRALAVLVLFLLGLVLVDALLLEAPLRLANQAIQAAYSGQAPGPLTELFNRIAEDAYKTPLVEYQFKAAWAYGAVGRVAEGMVALLLACALLSRLFPASSQGFWAGLRPHWGLAVLAGGLVGFTVAIRPIGGLAGLLVSGYALHRVGRRAWALLAIYWVAAGILTYAAWPYLWPAPLPRLLESLGFSTGFDPKPTQFRGRIVRGDALPLDYFPTLAAIQLTEPILPLFLLGVVAAVGGWRKRTIERSMIVLLVAWIGLPLFALIGLSIGVYNNLRQLHFVLPVVFAFAGIGLAWLLPKFPKRWMQHVVFTLALIPGLVGIVRLRPYEYAYFNSFVGGVRGAADAYALEYWCTSYREAMAYVNQVAAPGDTVLAFLAPDNARPFARKDLVVTDNEGDLDDVQYVLTCTYALGDDWSAIPMRRLSSVGRQGVPFAEVFEMQSSPPP